MNRITKVKIAECSFKLPYVLRLGSTEIRTRDYVALRMETEAGIAGEAIGYPRGAPLFEIATNMARQLMGKDARMRRQCMEEMEYRNVPGRAALTRGLSLFDIALWDIACKEAEQPLYRYLGGLKSEAKVTAVAGYYMDRRSIEDIADEVSRLLDEGYPRVKVMLKGDDPVFDAKYAAAVCERGPGRVAADAHWSWTTLTEAKRLCSVLDEMELDFLEDPFAANDIRLTHALQLEMNTPIAAGEDVFGPNVFLDLASGIGIVRVDATTCGGVTGAVQAIGIAAAAGKAVFPHVFAPLHAHLACAFANVEGAEFIPEESGADPLGSLLVASPQVHNGVIRPSEEPGVGIQIDWTKVAAAARRVTEVVAEV
ncbi:MAG TPA: enolase C-terminal domain-like protein [Acidobacteriaceae bacterium]|nr:enolase C-terminal domain-like protein [Acidobacteriaceae bacterium]